MTRPPCRQCGHAALDHWLEPFMVMGFRCDRCDCKVLGVPAPGPLWGRSHKIDPPDETLGQEHET